MLFGQCPNRGGDLLKGASLNDHGEMMTKTTQLCRVAEVGRLSASAKNAFNSFVGRVFANSRQKTLFFHVIPKSQHKNWFLPSFTSFT